MRLVGVLGFTCDVGVNSDFVHSLLLPFNSYTLMSITAIFLIFFHI